MMEGRYVSVSVLAKELGISSAILALWAEVGLVEAVRIKAKRAESSEQIVEADGEWLINWRDAFELTCDPLLLAASQEVVELLPFYRHRERALVLLAHKVAVRMGLIPVRVVAKVLGVSIKYASVLAKRKCNTIKIAGRRYVIPDLRWHELLAERNIQVERLAEAEIEPLAFLRNFTGKSRISERRAVDWVEISLSGGYTHIRELIDKGRGVGESVDEELLSDDTESHGGGEDEEVGDWVCCEG